MSAHTYLDFGLTSKICATGSRTSTQAHHATRQAKLAPNEVLTIEPNSPMINGDNRLTANRPTKTEAAMFTTRHFNSIAKVLKDLEACGVDKNNRRAVAVEMANLFAKTNSRFNRAMFFKACGLPLPEGSKAAERRAAELEAKIAELQVKADGLRKNASLGASIDEINETARKSHADLMEEYALVGGHGKGKGDSDSDSGDGIEDVAF